MSGDARQVVIVCDREADSAELAGLVHALRQQGASVVVRGPDDSDDDLLDAIAESNVVVGWK